MSSFSNTTTRIIDPVLDRKNNRLEFRLGGSAPTCYLSNMRLLNIGITSDNAGDSYNKALGCLGAIRSISLLDGSVLLDQLQSSAIVSAWKATQKRNDENLSTERYLKYNALGYVASGEYSVTPPNYDADDIQVSVQNPHANSTLVGKEAWINLRDMLSFLSSSMEVPTNVYKQLRLVVEYNSAGAMRYLVGRNDSTIETTQNGLLMVDEINDGELKDAMMANYKGVVFRPLEVDSVVAPGGTGAGEPFNGLANTSAVTAQKEQNNSYLVNGFNGKKLHRIAVTQTPTAPATWTNGTANEGLASVASVASWKNSLQIRINGANKMSGAGQTQSATGDGSNRKLAFLNDTWGVSNIVQSFNQTKLNKSSDYLDAGPLELQGEQQFLACEVKDLVREFQLFYNRTGVYNNPKSVQQLQLNIIGETEKAVVLNNDNSYNVVYTQ